MSTVTELVKKVSEHSETMIRHQEQMAILITKQMLPRPEDLAVWMETLRNYRMAIEELANRRFEMSSLPGIELMSIQMTLTRADERCDRFADTLYKIGALISRIADEQLQPFFPLN